MASNVLVVGSGGREHALAWKIAESPRLGKLYVSPGNGGTCQIAENIPVKATDISELARFVEKNAVDITIVGPDDPLALGIVDIFQSRGLRIFGPSRAAAQIEASKAFAKRFMREGDIPTAKFKIFRNYKRALKHVRKRGAPIVIKASGLALGKGAYVCGTLAEAEEALSEIMLKHVHKDAGNEVIVEDFLEGQEISIHALCDGKTSVLMPTAQDHKAIFDGDKGKNTGGMGTVAPVPWVKNETLDEVSALIVQPAIDALAKIGRPFFGCLYPGLKMTSDGPKVLEFNARFGDPETQSYMRLLKTDLLDILDACVDGNLGNIKIDWHPGFAVCVVLASGGYPDKYQKGFPIFGIKEAEGCKDVVVFHAGTEFTDRLVTSGGRVLGVTATGQTLPEALLYAYEAVWRVRFKDMYFRKDIGSKIFSVINKKE